MTNRWGKSKNTDRFYFLRFQNHYRWWLQPWNFFQAMLAPRKKSYDKLRQHAEKQRHHLSTKVHTVKGMVFPVVMYRCDCWTIKKAEHWRIDIFWTVVLEKTLESPLDCKESKPVDPKGNQPWIFIARTDAEAEALIVGHLIQRANSLEKTLMLGKTEGKRRRGWQMMKWLDGISNSMDELEQTGRWRRWGKPGMLQFIGSLESDRT